MEWSIINQNRSLALNAVLSSTDGGRCSVEGVKWIWASRCRCGLQRNSGEETGPGLGIRSPLPILPMQTDTQHGGLE